MKLYKKSSTGKIRVWHGWVENNNDGTFTFKVETGFQGGSMNQTAGKEFASGKQGRTAREQAELEMTSKANKKKDEGYFPTVEEAESTRVVLPMLAHPFEKRGHNIEYPAIGQRKFDGVRCMASVNPDNSVNLLSRKGKPFPHLQHLRDQVAALGVPSGMVLDGELYSHDLPFEEVVGLVRRGTLKTGDEEKQLKINYRLYDAIPLDNIGFIRRYNRLAALPLNDAPNIILTENVILNNADEVRIWHDQFVEEGFEGIMIRNRDGEYQLNKRSRHLQKFKRFEDSEFEIVGYEEGSGNDKGTVIWVLDSPNGQFKARPTGSRDQRREWFQNGDSYIGKMLTVRYFELTEAGVPRFPIGVAIRDYE